MTKTAVLISSALAILAMVYSVSQPEISAQTQIEIPSAPWIAEECTTKLEI